MCLVLGGLDLQLDTVAGQSDLSLALGNLKIAHFYSTIGAFLQYNCDYMNYMNDCIED